MLDLILNVNEIFTAEFLGHLVDFLRRPVC